MLGGVLDTLATRHASDGVDVEALIGNDACGSLYLSRFQRAPHDHQDIAVLALVSHPVLVLIVANGREANVYPQFGGLEQQFLHHLTRVHLVHADENAQ